jgi:hypothetical protein
MLTDQGFVVGELDYVHEHGWEFSARITRDRAKTKLWFRVTLEDDVVLRTLDTTFSIFGKTDHKMFGRTLTKLSEQLSQDSRFRDLRWYTPASYAANEPGYAVPVD